jgi:hypothetical protein
MIDPVTDDYIDALQQTFTDKERDAIQWLSRVTAQMMRWLTEAGDLAFPGAPMPPAERLAIALFTLAGDTDSERRRAFDGLGPQSPRERQTARRRQLASAFLYCQRRGKVSKEEFVRSRLRVNKQLPKTEQRGANSVNHTALLKCLDRGLKEVARRPILKAELEVAYRADFLMHVMVSEQARQNRRKMSGQT